MQFRLPQFEAQPKRMTGPWAEKTPPAAFVVTDDLMSRCVPTRGRLLYRQEHITCDKTYDCFYL
jgi:hypothetical protein